MGPPSRSAFRAGRTPGGAPGQGLPGRYRTGRSGWASVLNTTPSKSSAEGSAKR